MAKRFHKSIILFIAFCIVMFPLQKASAFENFVDAATTVNEIMDYTSQYHIDQPKVDDLANAAIEGMMQKINDPYTEYMSPEDLKSFQQSLNNDYVGIGVLLNVEEGYPKVERVFDQSPAQEAGLQAGDRIIAINGVSVSNKPIDKILEMIKSNDRNEISLNVLRQNVKIEVKVTQSEVKLPTVTAKMLDDQIAYMAIEIFGDDTGEEFASAIKKLPVNDLKGIILDLRDNPGGEVTAASQIAGEFLPAGKDVVSYVTNDGEKEVDKTDGNATLSGIPLAVLVNDQSASAAEILSGDLQDYQCGKLVGSKTYGKGSVQTVIGLSNGGALKVTIARYTLPSGRSINHIGLTPDVQVLSPGLELAVAKHLLQPETKSVAIFTLNNYQVKVNDMDIITEGKPYVSHGQIYVPLRFTLEAMGYGVYWDNSKHEIKASLSGQQFFISSKQMIEHDGLSFATTAELSNLGIKCSQKNQMVTVTK